jgi:acyl dehydratase
LRSLGVFDLPPLDHVVREDVVAASALDGDWLPLPEAPEFAQAEAQTHQLIMSAALPN